MPHTTYTRVDLTVALRRSPDGGPQIDAADGDVGGLASFAVFDPAERSRDGKVRGAVARQAREWAARVERETAAAGDTVIPRVVLRVEDRGLQAHAWDAIVRKMMDLAAPPEYVLVRHSPVPARDGMIPWTLPLRILHVDAEGRSAIRRAVDERFGVFAGGQAEHAVRVREIAPGDLPAWHPSEDWPTAEVVHLGVLPELEPAPVRRPAEAATMHELEAEQRLHGQARLSVADPERPGTLGWLARFTDQAQTRLLVLEGGPGGELRSLAAALVARGGPAVLVLHRADDAALTELYDLLIHDRPLDWIARALQEHGGATLFAGAGREEALRVSGPGAELAGLAERLNAEPAEAERVESELRAMVLDMAPASTEDQVESGVRELIHGIQQIGYDWSGLAFEQHESAGLIPYSAELARVRGRILGGPRPAVRRAGEAGAGTASLPGESAGRVVGQGTGTGRGMGTGTGTASSGTGWPRGGSVRIGRAGATDGGDRDDGGTRDDELSYDMSPDEPWDEGPTAGRDAPAEPPGTAAEPPERWVNPGLWSTDGRGRADEIPQAGARLTVGRVYYLGVRIGRRDVHARVLAATPILDELLKWRPEDQGTWVEVGVTGIGFDVLGDPVQELWLPRAADAETIRFAVVPREEGVAVLRFILYHRNSVVQSFRLAAVAVAGQGGAAEDAPGRLAAALGVDPGAVRGEGWLARLEFSAVAGPDGIASRPARDLSIVANDVGGKPVITVKTAGDYDVRFPGNMAPEVQRLRTLLDAVATENRGGRAWYRFGRADPARPNAGGDAELKEALKTLAQAGWNLYTQLLSQEMRAGLARVLEGEGERTIRVAHVLMEKVIPWSLVYDRFFSPNPAADESGQVPAVDACLAALPGEDGTPSPVVCGGEGCLLGQATREQRARDGLPPLSERTVACPRHFWGFRHVVEISPKAVSGDGTPVAEVDAVESGKPARLLAAFNGSLALAQAHLAQLEKLETWSTEFAGPRVRGQLQRPDLDLIYLYCHARGGAGDPSGMQPCLEFVDDARAPVPVAPADLVDDEHAWAHHPLVVLNGCGTVGFSPDALSPFLPILVDDRGAAGLLGTEISVWEQLAGEFAEHFLAAFLAGRPAGAALLEARRRLLAQRNPLGLAYTLYANADLRFTPAQPPAAAAAAAAAVTAGQPGGAPGGG